MEIELSPAARRVAQAKAQLAELREQEASDRGLAKTIVEAEEELEAAISAPVPTGRDPFEELPDEVVLAILLRAPYRALFAVCVLVCHRWRRLIGDAEVVRHLQAPEARWVKYEEGWIEPQRLEGHTDDVSAVAIAPDGTLYSGSWDTSIFAWNPAEGRHLRTLAGHSSTVTALAVATDGTLYSGGFRDWSVLVWPGGTGPHLEMAGHTDGVLALAIGGNGKLYSGSGDNDGTIRVWSTQDRSHLYTLEKQVHGGILSLAIGEDGKVYSCADNEIIVWSGEDGARLQYIDGHKRLVTALAIGPEGNLFSSSRDKTVQVWSGEDGTLLRAFDDFDDTVESLALGTQGILFVSTGNSGWPALRSSVDGSLHYSLDIWGTASTCKLLVVPDGTLVTTDGSAVLLW